MVKKILHWRGKSSKSKADSTHSSTLKVNNELGIHARSAALFAKVANQYESEVTVQKGSQSINAKSIMGLLTLAAAKGSKIKVITEGPDAAEALTVIRELVKGKFGEK